MTKKTNRENQTEFKPPTNPLLIVLSGPSGAGKDAILNRMRELGCPLNYVTTVTTRPKRPNERNDQDYHFVTAESFREMISHQELLEWANVYGHWYGVPRKPVKQALHEGKDAIVKVDTQGAATIKRIAPQAVFIFVIPPSMAEIITRLELRRTESAFDLAVRIKTAEEEIKQLPLFDYVVINKRDEIRQAVSDIKAIVIAEKRRAQSRKITL